MSHVSVYFLYLIAGLLTKNILINAGDKYNENVVITPTSQFIKKEPLTKSVAHLFANPPLKSSIFIFMGLVYFSSDIRIELFRFQEILFYIVGLLSPKLDKIYFLYNHLFKKNVKETTLLQSESEWYQQEEPVKSTLQDRLNRKEIVSRMCDIIVNSKVKDSRGIALIASYGMGKSSTINMAIESITSHHNNYIVCRIDAWGVYSTDEQIQKYIIEKLIKKLSSVVSTTNLSGLPSKYITSLKGAQSLWLDALPLFDNYRSPIKQCDQINELLERVDHYIILIIEDLDRNKEAKNIFNSIAPLIENLNGNGRIKFILSVGDSLNEPDIINRICRYKEFITFDKNHIYSSVKSTITTLLKESDLSYHCEISYFFSKNQNEHSPDFKARESLFSYINTPRDLKFILTQFSLDWRRSLKGCCDILDLLTVTVLKHYETSFIETLVRNNYSDMDFDSILKSESHLKINNVNAAEEIFNYFFNSNKNTNLKKHKRLQCCKNNHHRYFLSIVERLPTEKTTLDKEYFNELYRLKNLCKTSIDVDEILFYINKLTAHKNIYDIIGDFSVISPRNSALPILAVYCDCLLSDLEGRFIGIKDADKIKSLLKNSNIKNNTILYSLTRKTTQSLCVQNLLELASFYSSLNTCNIKKNNKPFIYRISLEKTMNSFIIQAKNHFIDEINQNTVKLFVCAHEIIQIYTQKNHKKNQLRVLMWLKSNDSTLSKALLSFIKDYYSKDALNQYEDIILQSYRMEMNNSLYFKDN
ncbi:P-loop NTPase fold protein [Aeromonas veronii]